VTEREIADLQHPDLTATTATAGVTAVDARDLVVTDYTQIVASPERFGGKAVSLARLALLGYRVPRFFVIPVEVQEALERGAIDPTRLLASVRQACDQRGMGEASLAVRSSATCEDGREQSFAGMFSSCLNVRGAKELGAAIKSVHASASSVAVEAYRRTLGITERPRMAIVIQEMIDASISGVAFSLDPTGTESHHVLVEAVFGLGEGLVGGDLCADRGWVDRSNTNVQKVVTAKKEAAHRCNDGSGTSVAALPVYQHMATALTPVLLSDVSQTALDIELDFAAAALVQGPSQAIDMEWCYHNRQLYVLQARPVTAVAPLMARAHGPEAATASVTAGIPATDGAKLLWDNANIVESYSGLVAPLTFTHARRAYRRVYEEFARVMGVPESIINAERELFGNMLGLLRGHVYYNLLNWYRLLSLFPNAERSAGFMETMMGVKEELGAESAEAFFAGVRSPYRPRPLRKMYLASIAMLRLFTLKKRMTQFEARVNAACDQAMATDYMALSVGAQLAAYEDLSQEFLSNWQAPIINDMRCMLLFGSLRRLGAKWLGASFDVNQVVRGHGTLGSAEPVERLRDVAHRIYNGDLPGLTWLSQVSLNQAMHQLRTTADLVPLRLEVEAYLAAFGFRCPEELKLEADDLYIDPTPVMQTLRAYVDQLRRQDGSQRPSPMPEVQSHHRDHQDGLSHLPFMKRHILKFLITHTAKAIADRERLRLVRGRTFSVARRIFRAMGAKLAANHLIAEVHDVFYLTVEELGDAVHGRGASADLASVAKLRRQEYVGYASEPTPPERFVTQGIPAATMPRVTVASGAALNSPLPQGASWQGTPCYPGMVTGKALVAKTFKDAAEVQGEVLVARSTDPGWVVLFPRCSALVIERGSLLSHSAVVARELGIPTIVGVSGITDALQNGDQIEVDAARGTIKLSGHGVT